MSELKYKAGTIILMSEGEYSDFGYCGQLVTLCELDLRKEVEKYKAQFKAEHDWDRPEPDGFCAWLCTTQQCAPLECQTVHLGSYGDLNP